MSYAYTESHLEHGAFVQDIVAKDPKANCVLLELRQFVVQNLFADATKRLPFFFI